MILAIESGTEICSVCIAHEGEVVSMRESVEGRDHARLVATFADQLLKEVGIAPSELEAVAVSMGPGSYTGFRIGVSFAKGLCYGAGVPLIGVSSLESLVVATTERLKEGELRVGTAESGRGTLAPMVDARRMEVYTQLFTSEGIAQGHIEAKIIDESSYNEIREGGLLILFGDGAPKCS